MFRILHPFIVCLILVVQVLNPVAASSDLSKDSLCGLVRISPLLLEQALAPTFALTSYTGPPKKTPGWKIRVNLIEQLNQLINPLSIRMHVRWGKARALADLIEDPSLKVDALVMIARDQRKHSANQDAIETLSEADQITERIRDILGLRAGPQRKIAAELDEIGEPDRANKAWAKAINFAGDNPQELAEIIRAMNPVTRSTEIREQQNIILALPLTSPSLRSEILYEQAKRLDGHLQGAPFLDKMDEIRRVMEQTLSKESDDELMTLAVRARYEELLGRKEEADRLWDKLPKFDYYDEKPLPFIIEHMIQADRWDKIDKIQLAAHSRHLDFAREEITKIIYSLLDHPDLLQASAAAARVRQLLRFVSHVDEALIVCALALRSKIPREQIEPFEANIRGLTNIIGKDKDLIRKIRRLSRLCSDLELAATKLQRERKTQAASMTETDQDASKDFEQMLRDQAGYVLGKARRTANAKQGTQTLDEAYGVIGIELVRAGRIKEALETAGKIKQEPRDYRFPRDKVFLAVLERMLTATESNDSSIELQTRRYLEGVTDGLLTWSYDRDLMVLGLIMPGLGERIRDQLTSVQGVRHVLYEGQLAEYWRYLDRLRARMNMPSLGGVVSNTTQFYVRISRDVTPYFEKKWMVDIIPYDKTLVGGQLSILGLRGDRLIYDFDRLIHPAMIDLCRVLPGDYFGINHRTSPPVTAKPPTQPRLSSRRMKNLRSA